MTTVNIDIEAMSFPLRPYQQDLVTAMITGGFKLGEMSIITAGRQTGKSYYNQFMTNYFSEFAPAYEQVDNAEVDGEVWHTVKCNNETAAWVRGQNKKYVYEHNTSSPRALFDIHEKLYTMLKIKFTP